MNYKLIHADCLEAIATMADNSIDAIVTDPPYHLVSINKRFKDTSPNDDNKTAQDARNGAYQYARISKGFMGKTWDGGGISFNVDVWLECYRVLKPGGHLLAFGGTRTYHRLAVAVEDAGFEIRDMIAWVYGSGFPKSHNIGKAIDKAAGAEREVVGRYNRPDGSNPRDNCIQPKFNGKYNNGKPGYDANDSYITAAATPEAAQWEGWGSALKPALEPIVLARKPLSEPTIAKNVLRWGTGGLNIDGTRIQTDENLGRELYNNPSWKNSSTNGQGSINDDWKKGRWPANLAHDGSDEVVAWFPSPHGAGTKRDAIIECDKTGMFGLNGDGHRFGDSGSAARFFYCAKASKADRTEGGEIDNRHPTIKPHDLMRWLCRLITPPGGLILDPFMGSGSTGKAAIIEGFDFVGIEQEKESFETAEARLQIAQETRKEIEQQPQQLRLTEPE